MLFEIATPEFKLVKQCRREVKMLEQLWDYIFLVRTCIDDWKTTMWRDIDVENMDMECKKFAKVTGMRCIREYKNVFVVLLSQYKTLIYTML